MLEMEKLFKEYEKLSYDDRREMLTELAQDIIPVVELMTKGREKFELLVLAACSADGKLGVEEYALVRDATGQDFSFDSLARTLGDIDSKNLQKEADEAVDSFGEISQEIKSEMVSFCLCLCSADNRFTLKEKSFIKKLLK